MNESFYTGKGIGVAILDTGIYPHIDFDSRICAFVDFIAHKKGCKNEYEGSTSNDKPSFPLLYHCFIPNKATSLLESK